MSTQKKTIRVSNIETKDVKKSSLLKPVLGLHHMEDTKISKMRRLGSGTDSLQYYDDEYERISRSLFKESMVPSYMRPMKQSPGTTPLLKRPIKK